MRIGLKSSVCVYVCVCVCAFDQLKYTVIKSTSLGQNLMLFFTVSLGGFVVHEHGNQCKVLGSYSTLKPGTGIQCFGDIYRESCNKYAHIHLKGLSMHTMLVSHMGNHLKWTKLRGAVIVQAHPSQPGKQYRKALVFTVKQQGNHLSILIPRLHIKCENICSARKC